MAGFDFYRDFDPDELQPWDRQDYETDTAYDRFRRFYLPLKIPRSVAQAYRDWKVSEGDVIRGDENAPGTWMDWSKGMTPGHNKSIKVEGALTWKERAQAWDLHLIKLADVAKMQRAIETAEADYQAGSTLRQFADNIMDQGPQFLKTTKRLVKGKRRVILGADGQRYEVQETPDQLIVTMALDWQAAIRAIKLASELQRKSADVSDPVQKMALTDAAGDDILPVEDVIAMLRDAQAEMEAQADETD